MIKTEFGIIDDFDETNDYIGYYPQKYNCIPIDDDKYLNDWWPRLSEISTFNVYNKNTLQPQKALSRWGITIIHPQSLPTLFDIVISDKRYKNDKHLIAFAQLIHSAIQDQKHMIHYGV